MTWMGPDRALAGCKCFEGHEMEEQRTFRVPNLCCNTCAALVRQSLSALLGVLSVQIVVQARRVTVQWRPPATWRQIEQQLDASGYPPGPPLV